MERYFPALVIVVFSWITPAPVSAGNYAETPSGRVLFERNCKRCHGADGAKGFLGAKNLQKSRLTDNELLTIISKGKRIMPAWEKKLSRDQIASVIGYVRTLRQE